MHCFLFFCKTGFMVSETRNIVLHWLQISNPESLNSSSDCVDFSLYQLLPFHWRWMLLSFSFLVFWIQVRSEVLFISRECLKLLNFSDGRLCTAKPSDGVEHSERTVEFHYVVPFAVYSSYLWCFNFLVSHNQ